MFSKVWCSRDFRSHWLSPSVSMPTSRYGLIASAVLIGITKRDVPAIGRRVEVGGQRQPVHLHGELHHRLDGEVARSAKHAPEPRVQAERAYLVRVGRACLPVHPAQQRLQPRLIVGVYKEV